MIHETVLVLLAVILTLLSHFHRFAALATRMEQYIQGQSRDLVDQAYTKFVSTAVSIEPVKLHKPRNERIMFSISITYNLNLHLILVHLQCINPLYVCCRLE